MSAVSKNDADSRSCSHIKAGNAGCDAKKNLQIVKTGTFHGTQRSEDVSFKRTKRQTGRLL